MTVLNQAAWANSFADPNQLKQFLTDWANGGAANHQVTGANDQGFSSYEQALADAASRGLDTTGLAQHVTAAPAPSGIGALDPAYEALYQQQLNNVGQQQTADLAQNDYSRTLAQQQGSQNLANINQNWDQTRNNLPGDYIHRGVYGSGSGLWQQGLQDYGRNRGQAVGQATDAYNNALRQIDVNAGTINQNAQNKTLDLEAQRQARYAGGASLLNDAKPFTVQ